MCLGPPRDNMSSLIIVLKQNIRVFPLLLLKQSSFVIFVWSCIVLCLSLQSFFCNNVSVCHLTSNHVQHQRTEHVEINLYFVRERVAFGHVCLLHVPLAR